MKTMVKCEACGGKEFKRVGNMYECLFCGSRYTLDRDDNEQSGELTDARVISLLKDSMELHDAGSLPKNWTC